MCGGPSAISCSLARSGANEVKIAGSPAGDRQRFPRRSLRGGEHMAASHRAKRRGASQFTSFRADSAGIISTTTGVSQCSFDVCYAPKVTICIGNMASSDGLRRDVLQVAVIDGQRPKLLLRTILQP